MTITIQIGNTDDKLKQVEWSEFVFALSDIIASEVETIHFFGCSEGSERWQNAAWVVTCGIAAANSLRIDIEKLRKKFSQDSVAWTEGQTEFV